MAKDNFNDYEELLSMFENEKKTNTPKPTDEEALKTKRQKKVDDFKKILIERDADYIFKKMSEEYSLDEIRNWYDEFYDVILKEYDETAKGMVESIITT